MELKGCVIFQEEKRCILEEIEQNMLTSLYLLIIALKIDKDYVNQPPPAVVKGKRQADNVPN